MLTDKFDDGEHTHRHKYQRQRSGFSFQATGSELHFMFFFFLLACPILSDRVHNLFKRRKAGNWMNEWIGKAFGNAQEAHGEKKNPPELICYSRDRWPLDHLAKKNQRAKWSFTAFDLTLRDPHLRAVLPPPISTRKYKFCPLADRGPYHWVSSPLHAMARP